MLSIHPLLINYLEVVEDVFEFLTLSDKVKSPNSGYH